MRVILAVFALIVWSCAEAQVPGTTSAPAPPSSNPAGKVDLVEGSVTVYDRNRAGRSVRTGDQVFEGDSVVTGRDGELHVAMEDGGYIAVRPNTTVSVIAYQANAAADDRSILSLLSGTLRSITGWIGKQNPRSYSIRTPTATIGVRGTDHEPLVIVEGSAAGEPGTYDKVNAGGSVIESQHGRVQVAPNQAGFAPLRGGVQPRLLAKVPPVFRPTRNEERLRGRHEEVQRSLDRLREARQKAVAQRREKLDAPKAAPAARKEALKEGFKGKTIPSTRGNGNDETADARKAGELRRDARPQAEADRSDTARQARASAEERRREAQELREKAEQRQHEVREKMEARQREAHEARQKAEQVRSEAQRRSREKAEEQRRRAAEQARESKGHKGKD